MRPKAQSIVDLQHYKSLDYDQQRLSESAVNIATIEERPERESG